MKDIDYELIVVDNDSKDETYEIIKKEFSQAILIRNELNVGFARANNLALQKAKGEFILLINPDTVWKRGEAKKAIQFMRGHPEIGALGCRLVLADGCWQKSHGNFPTLIRELKEAFYLPRIFPRSQWMSGVFAHMDHLNPKPVDWVSCTFSLCRRKLMAEVGFFDERYFLYYEDIDLSKRIRETGKEIYYYPEIEIIHHQRIPSIYDFGESPYIYFHIHFGLTFPIILRYILIFKTFLRIAIFSSLVLLTGKALLKEKLLTNYRTFKFHLFDASEIIRGLTIRGKSRPRGYMKI